MGDPPSADRACRLDLPTEERIVATLKTATEANTMRRTDGGVAAGSAFGALGAALAAVLGTLCCAGPAVVAILGTGGALAAARLGPYRPYLLGLSVAFLAVGFWRAYVPGKGAEGVSCSIR